MGDRRFTSRVNPAFDGRGEVVNTFAIVASSLWDVDEPDRFAKLALYYPDLLNHEEQSIWKLVRECRFVWHVRKGGTWDSF